MAHQIHKHESNQGQCSSTPTLQNQNICTLESTQTSVACRDSLINITDEKRNKNQVACQEPKKSKSSGVKTAASIFCQNTIRIAKKKCTLLHNHEAQDVCTFRPVIALQDVKSLFDLRKKKSLLHLLESQDWEAAQRCLQEESGRNEVRCEISDEPEGKPPMKWSQLAALFPPSTKDHKIDPPTALVSALIQAHPDYAAIPGQFNLLSSAINVGANLDIIHAIIKAQPKCMLTRSTRGDLPIHFALKRSSAEIASWASYVKECIEIMVDSEPQCLLELDNRGKSVVDLSKAFDPTVYGYVKKYDLNTDNNSDETESDQSNLKVKSISSTDVSQSKKVESNKRSRGSTSHIKEEQVHSGWRKLFAIHQAKPKEDQHVSIINKTRASQKSTPSPANQVVHDKQSKMLNSKKLQCEDQHNDEIPAGKMKKIRATKKPCGPEHKNSFSVKKITLRSMSNNKELRNSIGSTKIPQSITKSTLSHRQMSHIVKPTSNMVKPRPYNSKSFNPIVPLGKSLEKSHLTRPLSSHV